MRTIDVMFFVCENCGHEEKFAGLEPEQLELEMYCSICQSREIFVKDDTKTGIFNFETEEFKVKMKSLTINELISKLMDIRKNNDGNGNIPVFVEVNGQQEKFGNYGFEVHHHYHEKNIYNGIEQEEINEVILMPFADGIDYD